MAFAQRLAASRHLAESARHLTPLCASAKRLGWIGCLIEGGRYGRCRLKAHTAHARNDVFFTDDGLPGAAVIACTLGMGVFFANDMARHRREDGQAADLAAKGG